MKTNIMETLRNPTLQSVLNALLVPLLLSGIYLMVNLDKRFAVLEATVKTGMGDRFTGADAKAQADLAEQMRHAIEIRVLALEKVIAAHVDKPWHDSAGLELARIRETLKSLEAK